jgi:quercetin dioxygenase-like cupin family protein
VNVLWRLTESPDLQANVVRLEPGEEVAEHAEATLDVLVVPIAGEPVLTVDGKPRPLSAGEPVLLPRGARRSIVAGAAQPAVYLTVHRRRPGLSIGSPAGPGG